jgi:hypothetical protein
VPEGNAFARRYELHYQSKKVETPNGELMVQYGCLNFHAKRDGGAKLSLAIKNKWSLGWMKSWFYYRVPCLHSSKGGKIVYALHSRMSALDYVVEPYVECPDDDPNNVAFVPATATIGGQDVVEEFVACKMCPLASSFGFKDVTIATTVVSKVQTPLPVFPMGAVSVENASRLLAEVQTEAERTLGSFVLKDYDALSMANLPNSGRLNHIFEQMGLAYAPRPLPGTKAFPGGEREMQSSSIKKIGCQKGENNGKLSGSVQDGAPEEDRHCEGDPAEY